MFSLMLVSKTWVNLKILNKNQKWKQFKELQITIKVGIKGILDFIVNYQFLTGQDVMSVGLAGALYGGLLCASALLNRNLFKDLQALQKELKKSEESEKKEKWFNFQCIINCVVPIVYTCMWWNNNCIFHFII